MTHEFDDVRCPKCDDTGYVNITGEVREVRTLNSSYVDYVVVSSPSSFRCDYCALWTDLAEAFVKVVESVHADGGKIAVVGMVEK